MTTNLVYRASQTPLVFKDSGGDVALALINLGFGAGQVSARLDRGVGDKPSRYKWKGIFQFETAPVIGEIVEIHFFESDGTFADGTIGTTAAALTTDKRRNAMTTVYVKVDTTSATTDIVGSGIVWLWERYVSVGVWNGSAGDNLENTANASQVILTPMPDTIQAAA